MPRALAPTRAVAATLAVLSLSACKAEQQADPRTTDRLVQIVKVEPAAGIERAYTGVVAARVQSDLGFRVRGKVILRLVDTGQVVKLGQPLIRIDPTDLDLAITAREKAVAAARAVAVQTAADEARYAELRKQGWSTQQRYEQARAALDSANAQLAAAQADAQVARNESGYSLLLADADGTVMETLVEPGQVVTAGQIVIRLAHAGPREASVDLPETVRPAIGSEAEASLYGETVRVPAHLRQLSDTADLRTRTFEARYVMEGEGARAPLGSTVQLRLVSTRPATSVQLPLGAIDDEGRGPGVWVLDKQTLQVTYRPVQVRAFGSETVELSGGVTAGEQVVAMGGHFLHEGERVRVADQKAAME